MKISFEKKIVIGFVINLLVVLGSGWIYISLLNRQGGQSIDSSLEWIGLSLFFISVVLLTVVYFIIRTQMQAKNISDGLLSENKKLLQSIIDNTTNPIFIKKLNGEYMLVNKQYGSLFQISNEKIIGKTDHDFLPQTTAAIYRSSDLEVVKALKELKIEETIDQADGPHTYIAVKFPLYDSTGRVYAVGGISTDITERKKYEESMQIGDKFFKMSIEIMVVASKDKFIKINPALSIALGYSEKELLSESFLKYTHPDDVEKTKKEIDKLLSGSVTINFESRWICKNGAIKLLSWSASSEFSTGLMYAVAIDITERKRIEESVKSANTFFNLTQDMNIVASHEKFLKINAYVSKTLGYSDDELLNQPFLKYVHPDDIEYTKKEVEKLKLGIKTINFENRYIRKDNSVIWLSWSTTPDPSTGLLYAIARDVTQLKEAQRSLNFSERFFNMSFDVFFLSQEETIIKINPAFTRTFGFDINDIKSRSFLSFIHSDNFKTTSDELKKLEKGMPVTSFRTRSVCKDHTYKWIDWSITSDTQTKTLFAVGRDVSELIEIEESLSIANGFFEMSFDAFFVTKGKEIIKINPAFTKTLGYTLADLKNKSILEMIHPDYAKITSEQIANRTKGLDLNMQIEYPVLCKDGSYKWVETMISNNTQSETTYSIIEDITQKRKNEEELILNTQKLKENEHQIQTIFDGAPDPVIVIDKDSKIIKWNPKAEFIFGWKANEIEGKQLFEVIIPDQSREANRKDINTILNSVVGANINKTTEIEAINKDGDKFPISLSVSAAKIGESNIFIGFIRDISEDKKVINELYQQEEMLRLVLENIAEGVIVEDSDRKIIMTNYIANKIFGIQDDDKKSLNILNHFEVYYPDELTVFPSQNLPMDHALNGELIEDIDVVLFDPVTKDKKRVLISGRPLINQDDKVVAAVVTIKDISKYKQMEIKLKETEIKYRQLIGFNKGDEKIA